MLFNCGTVCAETIDGIKAYPVPFNPNRHTLTVVAEGTKYLNSSLSISFEIYDFNGEVVYKRTFSSFPIKWKGYSSNGEAVENGLYFIKMTVEDLNSGEIDKGIIRILVKK